MPKMFTKGIAGKKILVALVVLLLAALVVAGCGLGGAGTGQPDKVQEGQGGNNSAAQEGNSSNSMQGDNEGEPPISPQPAETNVTVTLYFSDKQAMYLVPVKRKVVKKGNETLEELTVKELIKGPERPDLNKTIPEGTKLLSLQVVDGIAYVNFSKEFKTNHWGGSTGETHTTYSVVNSLAKIEGIKKVQFLVDGDKLDSLAGHLDFSRPFTPDWNLVKE